MHISPKSLLPLLLLAACAGPSNQSAPAPAEGTVICTTDDPRSVKIAEFLDQYATGDLSFADQLFTEDARFYWSTNESSFGLAEWREGITQQHSVFKEIEMVDRVITTGKYPDGVTWTTVWAEWQALNQSTNERSSYLIHLAYKWEGDAVVAEYGFFDRGRYTAEMEAALGG